MAKVKKSDIVYTEPSNYFPPDLMRELNEGVKKNEEKKKADSKKSSTTKKKK